jgi:ADP-heptose:LPS heptosyltransferase
LCARAGITGRITLKPTFALTEQEQACGTFAENKVVIQSSGLAAIFPMRNKMWFPERFQGVVDHLRRDIEFVQLGSAADPELNNVLDLRGKTSIRQSASILHHARAYIGTVGFLMHLARAVECPSVIVYGGREAPWQSGYTGNINLYNGLPCAPCWRWNSCDFERKCMTDIRIADVVRAMRSLLSTSRGPLPVDTDELP